MVYTVGKVWVYIFTSQYANKSIHCVYTQHIYKNTAYMQSVYVYNMCIHQMCNMYTRYTYGSVSTGIYTVYMASIYTKYTPYT